jgi:hypothetical protein
MCLQWHGSRKFSKLELGRMKRAMIYITGFLGLALVGTFALAITTRAGYESAEYKVFESDGTFEVREYPDLMLVARWTRRGATAALCGYSSTSAERTRAVKRSR